MVLGTSSWKFRLDHLKHPDEKENHPEETHEHKGKIHGILGYGPRSRRFEVLEYASFHEFMVLAFVNLKDPAAEVDLLYFRGRFKTPTTKWTPAKVSWLHSFSHG